MAWVGGKGKSGEWHSLTARMILHCGWMSVWAGIFFWGSLFFFSPLSLLSVHQRRGIIVLSSLGRCSWAPHLQRELLNGDHLPSPPQLPGRCPGVSMPISTVFPWVLRREILDQCGGKTKVEYIQCYNWSVSWGTLGWQLQTFHSFN
jgi:hypothetical protein